MLNKDLYNKYDLLLPSKFDGGYLIIALYEKIKNGEIEEYFTQRDVTDILMEISVAFDQGAVRQWSNIKENLFHYFIRSHPDEPWKYYLTDYARNVVDLMLNKLENPYKNHPLKKSVQDSFSVLPNEIQSIDQLERKFGRIFIQGSKKIILDHLEALEDELRRAYAELNTILQKDEENATDLVKQFAIVFRQFGERAEDITEAIISKDQFLSDLRDVVDVFYSRIKEGPDKTVDWGKARDLYTDLQEFFQTVDNKVKLIRRQINHASEKLTELQEQFSSRADFRLKIKKLHRLILENASYAERGVLLNENFPLKKLIDESPSLFFPKYYEFGDPEPNLLITIQPDEDYEREEKQKIDHEIARQELINSLVQKSKSLLAEQGQLSINELMENVIQEESDLSIAYQVVSQVIAYASESKDVNVDVERKLLSIENQNIALWKTKIMK